MKGIITVVVHVFILFNLSIPCFGQTNQLRISEVIAPTNNAVISPYFSFDKSVYHRNDQMHFSLAFRNINAGDRTNSTAFLIRYNADVFDIVTMQGTYIPFNIFKITGKAAQKTICAAYVSMTNEISLKEGSALMNIWVRIKSTAPKGKCFLELQPVELIDRSFKVYNVNNGYALKSSFYIR